MKPKRCHCHRLVFLVGDDVERASVVRKRDMSQLELKIQYFRHAHVASMSAAAHCQNTLTTVNTTMSAPLPSPPNLAITMTPVAGSMNWEPVRQRLLSSDLSDALQAATELRDNIEIVHSSELSLFLSALLPAFSSVLAHKTRPTPDASSVDHQLRHLILDIISKIPTGSVLRPHAPHCVALCIDILNRDYEENALLASRIIFDLYKAYRSLPQDYVQPYLDFVAGAYKSLPTAIQRNFALSALESAAAAASKQQASSDSTVASSTQGSPDGKEQSNKQEESSSVNNSPDKGPVPMDTSESPTSESAAAKTSSSPSTTAAAVETLPSEVAAPAPPKLLSARANMSFRILTESPLIVMLMFQLWPGFLKTNIPVLIAVMMEALSLRAPPIQTIVPAKTSQQHKLDVNFKRMYYSRVRELVAAQAKTLSFVTYLLRSFLNELKPYEERLATNVVALMTTCPRESIATRKELLVATRHLLNTDFRKGFFRHVDSLLDERVLIGKGLSFSDQALLRPLGLTMLSDLVQHVRSSLNTSQTSRIVLMFARALHDSSNPLPISTQYTAVRTLLSMADVIFNNKDPNPQLGRDLLVRILITLTDKLQALSRYFPSVLEAEQARAAADSMYGEDLSKNRKDVEMDPLSEAPNDSVRDLQIMIRAIIVGHKSLIFYIYTYREQRVKDDPSPVVGANEEVASALQRLTHTEMAIIDKYILAAFPATRLMKENGPGSRATGDKSRAEHHREALTYFAAAFTCLDGYYLARTLGKRLDVLVDMLVEDPIAMVFVRHLLGANATTSLEFCSLLLDHLVERMDDLALPRHDGIVFFDPQVSGQETESTLVKKKLQRLDQRPHESDERKKQLGLALLQLFERVLKSLSAFPANEATVRKHLRHIVVVCFRSSMEQTNVWPDNYCMLLRYVFRAISAGKFEESYKELLPLLPTVLNGLYRVSASNDVPLRNTAVELCLTIPARLSSLLPHLNLLIRVIIPALDSKSGDLVNLG
jgi:transformation/transcription domain-associated protein